MLFQTSNFHKSFIFIVPLSPPPKSHKLLFASVHVVPHSYRESGSLLGDATWYVTGTRRIEMDNRQMVPGGLNQSIHFKWSSFPQEAGSEYVATSIEMEWQVDAAICRHTRPANFTGYGVFRISKYITPDDQLWNGPLEQVQAPGGPRQVHSRWIRRVRLAEGVGRSQNQVVNIRGPQGNQRLTVQWEGAYVPVLAANLSLAKHQDETRFRRGDSIVLSTDTGHCFRIDDTGNWDNDPGGQHNHFDRFAGTAGPDDPDVDFPSAYVVKVPPAAP